MRTFNCRFNSYSDQQGSVPGVNNVSMGMVSVHEVFFIHVLTNLLTISYGHKCYIAIMTVENLSGRRVQHLLRPVGFNSQSTAGYISYPGKCHSNVIRCFKCFKCNFFQCFIDRFCRGGGMSWKFLNKTKESRQVREMIQASNFKLTNDSCLKFV